MTDPRILECAKALKLKAREIGLPVALTADQATDLARACTLKWLEQKASEAMINAGYPHTADPCWRGNFVEGCRAMNAQAIKEIG